MGEEKRILIVGGGGFLGKSVLRASQKATGLVIHAVGRGTPPLEFETAVEWHRANLLEAAEVERVFRSIQPTHLIQLAWCAEYGTYWRDLSNLEWVTANIRIAKAFIQHGGVRCLFAGTSAEYDWSSSAPFREFLSPLKPQLLYGASKLASYYALSALFEQEGISWVWTRFFCPFGQDEDHRRLIPKSCLRLLSGDRLDFDSALDLRDFLHSDDIASALMAILHSQLCGPVNVASGEAVTVREIITTLSRHLGREDQVRFAKFPATRHEKPSSITADITRLQAGAGWSPTVSLDERLKQTCSWWRSQHQNIKFQNS